MVIRSTTTVIGLGLACRLSRFFRASASGDCGAQSGRPRRVLLKVDPSYALRSTTIAVNRSGAKLNLQGEADDGEWDGQELAFHIADEFTTERVFMDSRLRTENVRLTILRPSEKPGEARRSFGAKAGRQDERNLETCAIDFTLQDLVDNFVIPDVPDVARVNPGG